MTSRPASAAERRRAAKVAGLLRTLLDEVESGRMDAEPLDRARVEGALIACEVLAGADVDSIVGRLLPRRTSDG